GSELLYNLDNVFVGVGIGGVVGLLLGIGDAQHIDLRRVLLPLEVVVGPGRNLVAAPLLLLWVAVLPLTPDLLRALCRAVILVHRSQRAAESVDPVYEHWAMTFGGGLGIRIHHILIPGTIPEIIGGLRITLASAWGLEVFAEILGAPSGIGQAIKAL